MNREIYEEYKQEHPEELEGVNRILRYSKAIEERRQKRRDQKIAMVETCRRILDGDGDI